MRKITIVGAGRVGESTAQAVAHAEHVHEIALIDIRPGAAAGTALDIQESGKMFRFDTRLVGSHENSVMEGSDLIVITAGLPRKPGMSRSDVLDANLEVILGLVPDVKRYAPDAKVIMVTNPVDIMTYAFRKAIGWDRNRVFGLAGVLDAARMAAFIAMETGYSIKDIATMVLGGHGDSMVPMTRFTTISGIPISHFLEPPVIEKIIDRTRQGGAEILALKQTSSANDSPAAAITVMIDAMVHNRKRILPCVAHLDGEYGEKDIAIGVPVVLGVEGVQDIIELELNPVEKAMFQKSTEQVRQDLASIDFEAKIRS
ncbi:MAG: malate dehydrogenase [Gammaproteobacteria bacterium]|nr:malate dehydrogenase [Gammaproteobacteria bacterium]